MFRFSFILILAAHLTGASGDPTPQAERGKKIFLDESKATHCATCHELEKQGTAIGPDLAKIARLSPKAIAVAVLASRTVYAQEVTLKGKGRFPAMVVSDKDGVVKLFNLSKMPPEGMTLEKSAVAEMRDNATWKHPPEATRYSKEELADVIAYIRWAAFGDTKGVTADELK